jgi:hypothetical protein
MEESPPLKAALERLEAAQARVEAADQPRPCDWELLRIAGRAYSAAFRDANGQHDPN